MALENIPMFSAMNQEPVKPPFPKPCRPLTSQEAHFAIMEKVSACINEVNLFEQRVQHDMERFFDSTTTENGAFKEAIQASYNSFLVAVQNEVNNFETDLTNNYDLFRNDINLRVANFETAINNEFALLQESLTDLTNDKVTELDQLKVSLSSSYTSFKAAVNSTVNSFMADINATVEEQNSKIDENYDYLVENLPTSVRQVIREKEQNGDMAEIIREVFGDTKTFKGSNTYNNIIAVTSPQNGDFYYCTDDEHYYMYTGSTWADIGTGEHISDEYLERTINEKLGYLLENNETVVSTTEYSRLVERVGGVYEIPLTFTFNTAKKRFESKPFEIPSDGFSPRIGLNSFNYNDTTGSYALQIEVGRMDFDEFIYDAELTDEHWPYNYTSRNICNIPPIAGCYARIIFNAIVSGSSILTVDNYENYSGLCAEIVKCYTGHLTGTKGVYGSFPVTINGLVTDTTSELYNSINVYWGLNTTSRKFTTTATFLPLEYVNSVTTDMDMWACANVFEFNPITRTSRFVEAVNYVNAGEISSGFKCFIDFSQYGKNYYAQLFYGKQVYRPDVGADSFNNGGATAKNVVCLGLDRSNVDNLIHIEWTNDNVIKSDLHGTNLAIKKNIELLRSIRLNTVTAMFGSDSSSSLHYIKSMKDFYGAFYGGTVKGGTFFYNISPVSYYTALLNPLSNAYGSIAAADTGRKFGMVCSTFTSLLMGLPEPYSTFDYRYGNIDGLSLERFNFNTDLDTLKRYDILVQGAGYTGHCAAVTELVNFDDKIQCMKYLESLTPATAETLNVIFNGVPFRRGTNNSEEWYQNAYDYVARYNPAKMDTIHDKANWVLPYTTPQKVMASRGYGSIYLKDVNRVFLSVSPDVETITLYQDGTLSASYYIADIFPTFRHNYNLVDITNYITPGVITVKNNVDDGEEMFALIDISEYTVSANNDGDDVVITTSMNEKVKYVVLTYKSEAAEGTNMGKTANMVYPFNPDENGQMRITGFVETEDNGRWSVFANADFNASVTAVFKTDYDTNTFYINANNVASV